MSSEEKRERQRQYLAAYRLIHKDEILRTQHEYRERNRERLAAYSLDYYWKHHDEQVEKMRQAKKGKRAELATKSREYYATHKEQCQQTGRRYRQLHHDEIRQHQLKWAEEHRADRQRYREAHKEEISDYNRQYMKANPDIMARKKHSYWARKHGATTESVDFAFIRKRDKMRCCICGRRVARKDLSFDHLVPLILGGGHNHNNVRVAHKSCNSRKKDGRLPVQLLLIGGPL